MPLLTLPCRQQTPNPKLKGGAEPAANWRLQEAVVWLQRLDSWLKRAVSYGAVLPVDNLRTSFTRQKDKQEQRVWESTRQLMESEWLVIVFRNSLIVKSLQSDGQLSEKTTRMQSKLGYIKAEHNRNESIFRDLLAGTHFLTQKPLLLSRLKEQMMKLSNLATAMGDELHYLTLEGWPNDHFLLDYFKEQVSYVWRRIQVYEELYLMVLRSGEEQYGASNAQVDEVRSLLQEYRAEVIELHRELSTLLHDGRCTVADSCVRRLQRLIAARVAEQRKVLKLYLHVVKSGHAHLSKRSHISELEQFTASTNKQLLLLRDEMTCLLLDNCPAYDEYIRHLKFMLQSWTSDVELVQAELRDIAVSDSNKRMQRNTLIAEMRWLLETQDRNSCALRDHMAALEHHGCLQQDESYHEVLRGVLLHRQTCRAECTAVCVRILQLADIDKSERVNRHTGQKASSQSSSSSHSVASLLTRPRPGKGIVAGVDSHGAASSSSGSGVSSPVYWSGSEASS